MCVLYHVSCRVSYLTSHISCLVSHNLSLSYSHNLSLSCVMWCVCIIRHVMSCLCIMWCVCIIHRVLSLSYMMSWHQPKEIGRKERSNMSLLASKEPSNMLRQVQPCLCVASLFAATSRAMPMSPTSTSRCVQPVNAELL